MDDLKVFTFSEATELLPKLTTMLTSLKDKRDVLLNLEVEIDALEIVSATESQENPSAQLREKINTYQNMTHQFYALVDEIHALGCFLKDVSIGLVDFYYQHEGQVVYLCWKLGEPKISYWHEIGKGFTHREPLQKDL